MLLLKPEKYAQPSTIVQKPFILMQMNLLSLLLQCSLLLAVCHGEESSSRKGMRRGVRRLVRRPGGGTGSGRVKRKKKVGV